MKYKYPRTYHLPFSQGVNSDDKILKDLDSFENERVIVTVKMDGENTTIGKDYSHARSLDSGYHPSRNFVKVLQGSMGWKLMDHERVCGENLYAKHSIYYENLPDYFLGFSFWTDDLCLDWDSTIEAFSNLDIKPVEVLYDGIFDLKVLQELTKQDRFNNGSDEGFVVRLASSFLYDEFSQSVVKWVRENHVQTDEHWMFKEMVENKLLP